MAPHLPTYRDKASSSSSAALSDSEPDTGPVSRTSVELAEHDQEVLDDEEEREKLLTGQLSKEQEQTFFQRLGKNGRRRRSRRHSRRNGRYRDEKGELMYEMEEGGPRSATPMSSSSEEDQEKVGVVQSRAKKPVCDASFRRQIRLFLQGC